MSKILVKHPEERIKLEAIGNHPWLNQVHRVNIHFSRNENHSKDHEFSIFDAGCRCLIS